MGDLAIRTPPEPFPPLRVNRCGWHTMGELPETASISTIFTTLRPPGSGEDGGSDKPSEPVGDCQDWPFPRQRKLRQMLR